MVRYSVEVSSNIKADRQFPQHILLHQQISTPRRPYFGTFLGLQDAEKGVGVKTLQEATPEKVSHELLLTAERSGN